MHNAIVTIYSQVVHQASGIRRFWLGVSPLSYMGCCDEIDALLSVEVDMRTLLPAALACVPFGFVLVRGVRVRSVFCFLHFGLSFAMAIT